VVSAAVASPVAAVVVDCWVNSKLATNLLHAVARHLLANAQLASAAPAILAALVDTSAKQSVTSTVTLECKATLAAA